MLRGIRGATTVERDAAESILKATRELLLEMLSANEANPQDLVAAFFTLTPDLNSTFPAKAARDLGWNLVPLIDNVAPFVHGSLEKCVRVMLLWNTDLAQEAVRHIYLRGATGLRPDLSAGL